MKASRSLSFDPIRRAAVLWERTWGERSAPQEMAAATSIMRVQQLLLGHFDSLLAQFDLTFARFEALVLLRFSRDGRLPMSIVGERLMVHATSATSLIRRLEEQGYVTREPNPRDGRGRLAAITPDGRAVVEVAMARLVGVDFGVGVLTDEERSQLVHLLDKVRHGHGDVTAGVD